jgi:hypothetical protein
MAEGMCVGDIPRTRGGALYVKKVPVVSLSMLSFLIIGTTPTLAQTVQDYTIQF